MHVESLGQQVYGWTCDYDPAGNRTRQALNGVETTGGANTYFTWTADGEMATRHDASGWSYYTWDVDESLKRIQTPTTELGNRYNSRMQRVERIESGAVTYMLYDGEKLAAEKDGSLATTRGYASEGDSIYAPLVAQSGSEHWFLFDALGTTLGLTSDAGALTDAFLYEAFGTGLGRTGSTATPYKYVGGYGYWNEPNVGMEYVWLRWFQAPIGSWVSNDPIPLRTPFYAYASNSPLLGIDPRGSQLGPPPGWNPWDPRWVQRVADAFQCSPACQRLTDELRLLDRLLPRDFWGRCESLGLIATLLLAIKLLDPKNPYSVATLALAIVFARKELLEGLIADQALKDLEQCALDVIRELARGQLPGPIRFW